jgi:hypothetical protein
MYSVHHLFNGDLLTSILISYIPNIFRTDIHTWDDRRFRYSTEVLSCRSPLQLPDLGQNFQWKSPLNGMTSWTSPLGVLGLTCFKLSEKLCKKENIPWVIFFSTKPCALNHLHARVSNELGRFNFTCNI